MDGDVHDSDGAGLGSDRGWHGSGGDPDDASRYAVAGIMRPHILLIDDEQGIRDAWSEFLQGQGHVVTCMSEGRVAQRAIFREPRHYDLILCDLDLPDLMGDELLESILPLVAGKTPIVIVSGHRHLIEALGELRNGAFSVLHKPCDLEDLRDTVRLALEQRKLYEQLRRLKDDLAEYRKRTQILLDQNEELAKRVRVDALTETANRVRLFEDLRTLDANHHRYGTPYSVALVDVDGFGRFNKTYRTEIGDAVLKSVASHLRRACREGDTIYRYGAYATEEAYRLGGDEFVLVLASQDLASAVAAMNRIRERVEEGTKTPSNGCPDDPVTISAGVVTSDERTVASGDDLIREANEKLKLAKLEGGNRVEPSEAGAVSEVPSVDGEAYGAEPVQDRRRG